MMLRQAAIQLGPLYGDTHMSRLRQHLVLPLFCGVSHGVMPSAPHHCVVNGPGNDSKNSSSTKHQPQSSPCDAIKSRQLTTGSIFIFGVDDAFEASP
jgi:hypothetical protein